MYNLDNDNMKELEGLPSKWSKYPGILWHGEKTHQIVDHGLQHANNLVELAENLLMPLRESRKMILNGEEFLTLRFAIWLHDIGHRGNEKHQVPLKVRDFHGIVSGLLILEDTTKHNGELYKLPLSIAIPVALVSMYHQRNCPFNESDRISLNNTLRPLPEEISPKNARKWVEKFFDVKVDQHRIPNVTALLLSELLDLIDPRSPPTNVIFTCALLRFIDTIDFRFNRVGLKLQEDSRKWCLEKEMLFYLKEKGSVYEKLKHGKVPEDLVGCCKKVEKKWRDDESMSLRDLEKEPLLISKISKHKISKHGKQTLDGWLDWIRYLAFIRDQINCYYPLHSSVRNVYFRLSGEDAEDSSLDLVFDLVPAERIAFETCCKRIMTEIKEEWYTGNPESKESKNEKSVGETLSKRGVEIGHYVFRDGSEKETYYLFPDGKEEE